MDEPFDTGDGSSSSSLRTPMIAAETTSAATTAPTNGNGTAPHAAATSSTSKPTPSDSDAMIVLTDLNTTTTTTTTDGHPPKSTVSPLPLKSVFSWRAHSVSATPNPLSVLSVIISVFLIPLGLTMCWVLLPLDVGVDTKVIVIDENTTTTTCNAVRFVLFWFVFILCLVSGV